jgi:hypothetical protein
MGGVCHTRALTVVTLLLVLFYVGAHTIDVETDKHGASGADEVCLDNKDNDVDEFFPSFPGGKVPYLGPDVNTAEAFAFRHYNESEASRLHT